MRRRIRVRGASEAAEIYAPADGGCRHYPRQAEKRRAMKRAYQRAIRRQAEAEIARQLRREPGGGE